jgi:hypothetical protein
MKNFKVPIEVKNIKVTIEDQSPGSTYQEEYSTEWIIEGIKLDPEDAKSYDECSEVEQRDWIVEEFIETINAEIVRLFFPPSYERVS